MDREFEAEAVRALLVIRRHNFENDKSNLNLNQLK